MFFTFSILMKLNIHIHSVFQIFIPFPIILRRILYRNYISCDRDSGRCPPKKDRVAKLHYITRHVRNGGHHIFKVMHSRHEKCECNEHFNMKTSRPQDSDAVYGVSKFKLSRNLWNFEICYFGECCHLPSASSSNASCKWFSKFFPYF